MAWTHGLDMYGLDTYVLAPYGLDTYGLDSFGLARCGLVVARHETTYELIHTVLRVAGRDAQHNMD